MKKNKKRKLKFNFIYNILLTLIFTVFVLIGYYYGEMNQLIQFELNSGVVMLHMLFLTIGCGFMLHVHLHIAHTKRKILLLILLGVINSLIVVAIVQPIFFSHLILLSIAVKVLAFFVETLLGNVLILAVQRVYVDAVTDKSQVQALTQKELDTITAIFAFYVLFMSALPMLILQTVSWYERIMLTLAFGLASLVLALINFIRIKKRLKSADDELIEEYRYLNMRARILPRYLAKYEEQIIELEKENKNLENVIEIEGRNKQAMLELASAKPELEKELAGLVAKRNLYDAEALLKSKQAAETQKDETEKELWEAHFAEPYTTCGEQIVQSEEQLRSSRDEFAALNATLMNEKASIQAMDDQLATLTLRQEEKKVERHEVTEAHETLALQLETETDEKTIKGINAKLEKLIKKETKLDEDVNALEAEVNNMILEKETLVEQVSSLEEASIPDLKYVIASMEEQLASLQEERQKMERAYAEMQNEDVTLQNLKEQIEGLTAELEVVAALDTEKTALEEKLSIDTDAETHSIDEKVAETQDFIDANAMQVTHITEQKHKTEMKIAALVEAIAVLEQEITA